MPNSDDEKVWSAYAKGVKLLAGKKPRKTAGKPVAILAKSRSPVSRPAVKNQPQSAPSINLRTPIDRNLERRLRQGLVEIEARLDLHGMHQDKAHEALHKFMEAQIKAARRLLLVITGKGRDGRGVLRSSFVDWLAASPLNAHIMALRQASLRHGGDGAFYVLLKRKK